MLLKPLRRIRGLHNTMIKEGQEHLAMILFFSSPATAASTFETGYIGALYV